MTSAIVSVLLSRTAYGPPSQPHQRESASKSDVGSTHSHQRVVDDLGALGRMTIAPNENELPLPPIN